LESTAEKESTIIGVLLYQAEVLFSVGRPFVDEIRPRLVGQDKVWQILKINAARRLPWRSAQWLP